MPKNSNQSPPMKPPKIISRPWRRLKTRRRAKTVPARKPDLVARMQALPHDQLQEILQKRVQLPSLLQTVSRAGRNLRHRANHIKVRNKKAPNTAKNTAASGLDFVKKDPELMLFELEAMKSLMLRQQYVSGLRTFMTSVARAEAETNALRLLSPEWEKKIAMVTKLQGELRFLIKSLQSATIATIKAVKAWRAQLITHARETGDQFALNDSEAPIFKWHDKNYLITVTTDVLQLLRTAPQSGWLRLWFGVTQERDWECWDSLLRCSDQHLFAQAERECTAAVDEVVREAMEKQEEALEALKEKERLEAEKLAMSAMLLDSDDEDGGADDNGDAGGETVLLSTEHILDMANALRRAIGPLEPLFDALLPRDRQNILQCQNYLSAEVRLQARVDAASALKAQAVRTISTSDRAALLDSAHTRAHGPQAQAARSSLRSRQEQGIAHRRLRPNGVTFRRGNGKRLRPRLAARKHTFAALVPVSVGGQQQTVTVRRRRHILVRKPVGPSKRTQSRSALLIQTQFRRFSAEQEYQRFQSYHSQVEAAKSVQKIYRGYNARADLELENDLTFLTQDLTFGQLQESFASDAPLEDAAEADFTGAATAVQSAYRGHRSRESLRQREEAARRIQAVRRGSTARAEVAQIRKHKSTILRGRARNRHNREQKKQQQAAARIQGLYRIREAKQIVKVEKAGAVVVGAARRRLEKVNDAAVTIQKQERRRQAVQVTQQKRAAAEKQKLEVEKATQIQSMFRARQGRKEATKRKLQLDVAGLSERQQSWLKGSGPASPVENKRTKATRKSVKKTDHAAPKPTATRSAPKKNAASKTIVSRRKNAATQPVAKGVLRMREATLDL